MPRIGALALAALALAAPAGCKRSKHAHMASFTPRPWRPGFVERSGNGWRVAVPSTWKDVAQKDAGGLGRGRPAGGRRLSRQRLTS